ncbi:MAG: RNB domain-containing ribonuclease [Treponema sp.]|nr:RNB domain-containing ribonuclease [Treponema sp.]MDY5838970.1 RNB domain-containing ribonuclease [Treponema sp.]
MIKVNSLVIYKNNAALVTEDAGNGKFTVKYRSTPATQTKPAVYSTQNVRTKDIILLHEGPVTSLEKALEFSEKECPKEDDMYKLDQKNQIFLKLAECYELLDSDDESRSAEYGFEELTSLFYGTPKADETWGLYCSIKNTLFFMQNLKAQMEGKILFTLRTKEEMDTMVKKANEKGMEAQIRAEFIERLKKRKLLPEDSIFMGDVEALAQGKTDKSRTMHDANLKESPEKAHKLLLETGLWDITRNPYPLRWGLSTKSATEGLSSPPEEDRTDIPGFSYAIDNEGSTDPDDAVAYDGKYLWVHIADPASTVMPDSSIDKAACQRGATLYIPEGAARMLCEDCLEDYALGLKEKSRALSFRILLNSDGGIEECQVMKTIVNVKRLTYQEADKIKDSDELKPLFDIARKNIERRSKSGAVQITMPEIQIRLEGEEKKVVITNHPHTESSEMIREMMLLAGEGAAKFAFRNNIPFPFVSQEAPTIPEDIPEGLAGQFRLRRCMRKRNVGVTPGMHSGLGLALYSQVTSPLRRYSDLIAHQQLRAFIDGKKLMDKDTMLMKISEGDAGAMAAKKAERNTNMHWTLVYLLQNPDWTGEAICVDNTQKLPQFSIPSLALETYIGITGISLNEKICVKVLKIDLSELSVEFQKI